LDAKEAAYEAASQKIKTHFEIDVTNLPMSIGA